MKQQPPLETLLQELELSLLMPKVRKSARVEELLADNFVEFSSSGRVLNKAQIIASLQAEHVTQFTTSNFITQKLTPAIALVTYQAQRQSTPPVNSLRSSLWEHKNGQWQIFFHQGTLTEAPKN